MSINIVNQGALEARMLKARKEMSSITSMNSNEELAISAIKYYLDALKKKKIIT
tara:strand:- start:186 stop:347 length:162 start_codon:yes stop_codon:yes gene_type:complete